MLEIFSTTGAWVRLATLTGLEIVLGIDNVVFITVLAGKLPKEQRRTATRLGLAAALITRLAGRRNRRQGTAAWCRSSLRSCCSILCSRWIP